LRLAVWRRLIKKNKGVKDRVIIIAVAQRGLKKVLKKKEELKCVLLGFLMK